MQAASAPTTLRCIRGRHVLQSLSGTRLIHRESDNITGSCGAERNEGANDQKDELRLQEDQAINGNIGKYRVIQGNIWIMEKKMQTTIILG